MRGGCVQGAGALDIGLREVVTLEQQRHRKPLCHGIREAVPEIEPGPVASLAIAGEGGDREVGNGFIHRDDTQCGALPQPAEERLRRRGLTEVKTISSSILPTLLIAGLRAAVRRA